WTMWMPALSRVASLVAEEGLRSQEADARAQPTVNVTTILNVMRPESIAMHPRFERGAGDAPTSSAAPSPP
ncbi:MAG: hypothetical protein LJF04_08100, partial [Gemmatimonadetes bacterium]|nr:hypothetical protein [Gemmatimonadota bacterium]